MREAECMVDCQTIKNAALVNVKEKVLNALENMTPINDDYTEVAKATAKQIIKSEVRNIAGIEPKVAYSELLQFVYDDLFGLGCLETLLKDPSVTDIMVEGIDVYIIAGSKRLKAPVCFTHLDELKRIIDRITSRVGKRIDAATPYCDCHLYEGSRCHIIAPPASDRHYLTIRKLGCMDLLLADWVSEGVVSEMGAEMLALAVEKRRNILISGGTGAGKTTLLNTLAKKIDDDQVIVTLEDTYELNIKKVHTRRLLTRSRSIEGAGQIDFKCLLKNALRMNPDRLIMGEVRDQSAYDLLHALNIGHKGSISTIHANSVCDALWRLETLALSSVKNISLLAIKRQIARVINVVVQLRGIELDVGRYQKRQVLEISEIAETLTETGEYSIRSKYIEAGV